MILFDAPYDGTMRKGIAQAAKTGWVYILDRVTGKPLIGIVETPVMQEPQQHTSATQPFPIGDAIVPQSHRHCARGLRARQRRPDLHAVQRRQARALETARGRQLAAELVRSR